MALVASCRRLPAPGSAHVAAGWLVAALQRLTAAAPASTMVIPPAPGVCPYQHGVELKSPAVDSGASATFKPYSQIPSPKGLPILGTRMDLVANGGYSKIHEYCDRRHRELGPIYREKLGNVEAVFVADSHLIRTVYQNEGKYPIHMVPEPWTIYNEATGVQRGLFFMDGPLWSERRKSLNKVFLRPQVLSEHTQSFSDVIGDVLNRWKAKREPDGTLPQLEKELYNWSIESLGTMIFGRRLGCISSHDDLATIHEFVHCVQQIFAESAKMTMIPPKMAYMLNLPIWKRFAKAAGRALQLAREYVQENMSSRDSHSGILGQLLLEEGIGEDEMVRIVTDLFLAAADTTSHATQWTLHMLATNPECQTRLLEEAQSVVPAGQDLQEDHLANMPYLKAVIKEALRLYPVAPFLTRILSSDLELGGYQIPSGKLILMSVYTTGRDPKYFNEPDRFRPERWLRKQGSRNVINTHACLPFGLGSRSCIGRRVAEVQMQLLLSKTVQQFNLSSGNDNGVDIHMRMITTPSEPIRLRLQDRTASH